MQQAGGYDAALHGTSEFKDAWADLSRDENFLQSQYDFIAAKKLNPTLQSINDIKGWNLDTRSPVVRDVLFSTATQHGEGGAAYLLHKRFGRNSDISSLSDEKLINQIYDERKDTKRYFKKSSESYQDSLRNNRFPQENAKALELLKKYHY